jgi:hypothetical protein
MNHTQMQINQQMQLNQQIQKHNHNNNNNNSNNNNNNNNNNNQNNYENLISTNTSSLADLLRSRFVDQNNIERKTKKKKLQTLSKYFPGRSKKTTSSSNITSLNEKEKEKEREKEKEKDKEKDRDLPFQSVDLQSEKLEKTEKQFKHSLPHILIQNEQHSLNINEKQTHNSTTTATTSTTPTLTPTTSVANSSTIMVDSHLDFEAENPFYSSSNLLCLLSCSFVVRCCFLLFISFRRYYYLLIWFG